MGNKVKISLAEAAERVGLDVAELLGYIAAGLLPAEESGDDWLIDPDDLEVIR
ncbi:MAG: hypothetical protein HYZ26_02835 [Chloroflexi bacterium]|nr:hypothetical protein [Chloroflexota bacterium]